MEDIVINIVIKKKNSGNIIEMIFIILIFELNLIKFWFWNFVVNI